MKSRYQPAGSVRKDQALALFDKAFQMQPRKAQVVEMKRAPRRPNRSLRGFVSQQEKTPEHLKPSVRQPTF